MSLAALLKPKAGVRPLLESLRALAGGNLAIEDVAGPVLFGDPAAGGLSAPIHVGGVEVARASGPAAAAAALLLEHLLARESERRSLAAEVLHLYREIHLIENLSEQLAALLDLRTVSETALAQARRLIPATSGAILIRDSIEAPLRAAAAFGDAAGQDEASYEWAAPIAERGLAEITAQGLAAPLRGTQRTVGVIALAHAESHSSADLKLLNTIALQTASALENALLCAEMVSAALDREQLAGLQRELETARTIQHSLVPRVFPAYPERVDFDLHAQMTSAKAVGGDFFDFFLIDEHHLGLVIGDVSGKGIPAALYMAVTRTQIKTTALSGLSPAECLLEVNRVLVRDKVSSMFATCFYGILDTRTGELRYSNAGHNPPYVLLTSGAVDPLPMTGGLPLGMFAKLKCAEGVIEVPPGAGIFLYTDGVPEATNPVGDDFTDSRLRETLEGVGNWSARALLEHTAAALAGFTAEAPQSDDITMLALRRAPFPVEVAGR